HARVDHLAHPDEWIPHVHHPVAPGGQLRGTLSTTRPFASAPPIGAAMSWALSEALPAERRVTRNECRPWSAAVKVEGAGSSANGPLLAGAPVRGCPGGRWRRASGGVGGGGRAAPGGPEGGAWGPISRPRAGDRLTAPSPRNTPAEESRRVIVWGPA